MSHQTRQIGKVNIQSMELLGQAVRSITVPSLNTTLVLDPNRKAARFYGSHMDECDAVITYARPLTSEEQHANYEIAVKREEITVEGRKVPVFGLYADIHASDREMEQKIAVIQENYIISGIAKEGVAIGAVETQEIFDEVPEGYRCVRVYLPNA